MENVDLCADLNTDYETIISAKDREIDGLKNAILELNAKIAYLLEQQKLAAAKRFGVSSEKSQNSGQISLFEAIAIETSLLDEMTSENQASTTVKAHTRKKKAGKREADLSNLETEIIEYNLSNDEKTCTDCGEIMVKIGANDRSELKLIPAKLVHIIHRREVCKCVGCEKDSSKPKVPIIKANAPEPLISGSLASPSLVAHILCQKFLLHLPLYRLEAEFSRLGTHISRQTMSNWIFAVLPYLEPVYKSLKSRLLAHDIIHADDTTLQVLREPAKSATSKSYMWTYRTSGDADTPIIIYEYSPNRKAENAKNFLQGFKGYCHNDGYIGYQNLTDIINIGCFAHARRKFYDAHKITQKDGTPSKIGLDYCNRLFEFERDFAEKKMNASKRHVARMTHSKPLMQEFFAWAETVFTTKGTAIHTAITYILNQRQYLENVLLDGRLELSNNRCERSIKPFVIGRKNWLFCNSQSGAKASAVIFSIIETAKENGINPYEYIKCLLEKLPNTPLSQIDALLPLGDTLS